jgi:hypothetical protein
MRKPTPIRNIDVAGRGGTMNHAEALSKRLFEAMARGSQMVYREDQSRSIHDFDWLLSDGGIAAVEVTTATDSSAESMYATLLKSNGEGAIVRDTGCRCGWYIHPTSGATVKRIRGEVGKHLAVLEAAGIEHFHGPTDAVGNSTIQTLYRELGVSGGDVVSWDEPGIVVIGFPSTVGAVGASMACSAAMAEASKTDNRLKLGAAGTARRHLAVYVSPMKFPARTALVHLEPPALTPDLPAEITDIWVFTEGEAATQCSVWTASQSSAWRNVGPVSLTTL